MIVNYDRKPFTVQAIRRVQTSVM